MNADGRVLLGKRSYADGSVSENENMWQFPQGGINEGESSLDAMYRELKEETSIGRNEVNLIESLEKWTKYTLPANFRMGSCLGYDGQKQQWFLLKFIGESSKINSFNPISREFSSFKWEDIKKAITQIIAFKKRVYEDVYYAFKKHF